MQQLCIQIIAYPRINTIPKPRATYGVNSLIHQSLSWVLLIWSLYFLFMLKMCFLNIIILKLNMPSRKHGHIWNLTVPTIQNQETTNNRLDPEKQLNRQFKQCYYMNSTNIWQYGLTAESYQSGNQCSISFSKSPQGPLSLFIFRHSYFQHSHYTLEGFLIQWLAHSLCTPRAQT